MISWPASYHKLAKCHISNHAAVKAVGFLHRQLDPLQQYKCPANEHAADDNWKGCALFTCEVGEQGDGHDGFAEAHLIGEDTVQAASVDGDQPLQPHMLVLPQGPLQQERHLGNEYKRISQHTAKLIHSPFALREQPLISFAKFTIAQQGWHLSYSQVQPLRSESVICNAVTRMQKCTLGQHHVWYVTELRS
jgi:hypothetical protein